MPIVRWDLKVAAGKALARPTETAFEAGMADVVFMGASYNTLIGRGGTVLDLGVDNRIKGNWEMISPP